MGHHIAVVNHSGLGHVIPTLDVVTELVRRGHRVTYTTAGAAVEKVEATGATVVPYESVLAGVNLSVVDTPAESIKLLPLQVRESEAILRAMTERFDANPPDLVLFDGTLYHAGRILARRWKRPAAVLSVTLTSNEHFSLLDKMVEVVGRKHPRQHPALVEFATRMFKLLAAYGQSDVSLEEFLGQTEDLNLVFYPRSFQFAGDTFDDRFAFVGPNVAGAGEWTPPADGRPVLLVSLGTSVDRNPEFYRTCADTFADQPWQVLMTVPAGIEEAVGALPDNVEMHRWLPLAAVLEHTEVFVCHGGMGSLMAALSRAVPTVAVPQSPEAMVNSARLAELGLGRVIATEALTARSLQEAVEAVAADSAIRERPAAMRADIRAAGGGGRAADLIEGYLDRTSAGDRRTVVGS